MTESTAPASLEELEEAIAELQEYRDRLVSDTTNMAQKAKVSKSQMMSSLEPELQQIDQALENLQTQKTSLAGAS
jgi:predicted  nucleic acid-binding Zn-ribbon protein